MHIIYIGLGSNLDSPLNQVNQASKRIAQHPHFSLLASSHWYYSKAVGPGLQPDYVNGAIMAQTSLTPDEVLDALQAIEQQHDRRRDIHWGPRTLDLDLLLYDDRIIHTARLCVPHPRMVDRNFVLRPLIDIDAGLRLPDGRKIADILHIIGTRNLQQISL